MRFIITNTGNILFSLDGTSYSISKSHPRYESIKQMIQQKTVHQEQLLEQVEFEKACQIHGITPAIYNKNKKDIDKGVPLANIALREDMKAIPEVGDPDEE